MAALRERPYRHLGVHIPYTAANNQWSSNKNIERDGFIYINWILGHIFTLQSVVTGDIFVNKILQPGM
jgi:hypothetical protein